MRKKLSRLCRVSLFFIFLFSFFNFPGVAAQRIVSIRIDSTHCVGDSMRVTVGYDGGRNVVVENPRISISHPQRTFLPDGQACDSTTGSCTYRSPITFTAFDNGSVMATAADIDFVRLNIEHTWMGDIFIALECPNGQFASLMNAYNAHSACGDPRFEGLHGWDMTYQNEPTSTKLGLSERYDSREDQCDSSLNPAGEGWNYCWSEHPGHGYAGRDGLIYRAGNGVVVSGSHRGIIDSTHIGDNTHFFRPQQSFDSLIGCPLNGTWNIVVQDSWANDNGYIFDWQLAFNNAMYTPPHLERVEWRRGGAGPTAGGEEWQAARDSVFFLPSPRADTVVDYRVRVVLTSGDTLDTVFSVHWVEPYNEWVVDTLCQGDTARWHDLFFTQDTLHLIRSRTVYGCDSSVTLRYKFMPTYSLHDTLPYCANEAFMYEGVDYGGPMTIVVPHQTQYGCDSTVTVHLVTIDSLFHLQLQMSGDGEVWSTDTVLYGCQPMTVWLRDTTLFELWRRWDFGDGDTLREEVTAYQQIRPFTHRYDSVGVYSLMLTAESIHGCVDSAVLRMDAVQVLAVPEAEFTWSPSMVVNHDPHTQLVNESSPMDSLAFRWWIPTGDGGTDTLTEVSPFYRWPVGIIDVEVTLEAIWTHEIGDSLTLVCVDTVTHDIGIINEYLQFPNVVTPNGDGVNDRWEVVNLLECGLYTMNELWIYSPWGVQVYHVRNIHSREQFWDPTDYPTGIYYYRFEAMSMFGLVKHQGIIEVVR